MAHIHRAERRLTSLDVSPSPPEPAATADLSLADPLADPLADSPAQSSTTESPPSEPPPPRTGDGPDAAPPPPPHRSLLRRLIVPWGIVITLGIVIAVVVRLFVFQTFYVPSTSMNPTIKAGDRILVDKLAFHLHPVERGDIIVFRTPPTEHCGGPPVPDLVKRVIGLPGETISGRDGHVYIDGTQLAEPWLPKVSTTYTATFGPDKIPAGDYFMMGDHRTTSCDSRYWGPIKRSAIIGGVIMRLWPISSLRFY
jgi:signal peptidase I